MIRKRAQRRLIDFVRSRYELIKPEPMQGMFNARCFENAVDYVRTRPDIEVIECIYIDGGEPILHYINRDPSTGAYLETTLGFKAARLEYYRIRKIHPSDHLYIGGEFERAVNSWTAQFAGWFAMRVLGIERIL